MKTKEAMSAHPFRIGSIAALLIGAIFVATDLYLVDPEKRRFVA